MSDGMCAPEIEASPAKASSGRALLTAPAYCAWVALVTALLFGGAMLFRPAFSYAVRNLFGLIPDAQATPGSFYAVRVAPLFEAHCTGCHGTRRQKAQLRLDGFPAVMRGGKHGPVIRAGRVEESELITRIALPAIDEKAMPPQGRPSLSTDEITVIKLWVAAGASGVQPVTSINGAPPPVRQIEIPEIDVAATERERAPLAAQVKSLQARIPGAIAYASRGSADLEINASLIGSSFGDAELAALAPLQNRIVRLDLSGTAVTDASADILASMRQLRVLRLMHTRVTDPTIEALAGLRNLQSLNVVGTSVTQEALEPLRSRGIAVYEGNDIQAPSPIAQHASHGTR